MPVAVFWGAFGSSLSVCIARLERDWKGKRVQKHVASAQVVCAYPCRVCLQLFSEELEDVLVACTMIHRLSFVEANVKHLEAMPNVVLSRLCELLIVRRPVGEAGWRVSPTRPFAPTRHDVDVRPTVAPCTLCGVVFRVPTGAGASDDRSVVAERRSGCSGSVCVVGDGDGGGDDERAAGHRRQRCHAVRRPDPRVCPSR